MKVICNEKQMYNVGGFTFVPAVHETQLSGLSH